MRTPAIAAPKRSHYRQIFELTRLDEAIAIHDSEAQARGAARSEA